MEKEYSKEYPHKVFIKFRSEDNFVLDLHAKAFEEITKFNSTFSKDIIDSIGSAASKMISNTDTWKSNEEIEVILKNGILFNFIQSSPIISLSFKSLNEAENAAKKLTKSGLIVEIISNNQKIINQISQILKNKHF